MEKVKYVLKQIGIGIVVILILAAIGLGGLHYLFNYINYK